MFKVTCCRPGRTGVHMQGEFAACGEIPAKHRERQGRRLTGRAGVLRMAVAATAGVVGATASPAAAQDDFGGMVAVAGETVIIGKPGAARGPAALYRFERSETGAWVLAGTLSPPGTAASGSRLSPSMEWRDGRLVVGSGDPEVETGAYLFRDNGNGEWVHEASLENNDVTVLMRAAERAQGGPGGAAVDFSGIMRILQPSLRGCDRGRGPGGLLGSTERDFTSRRPHLREARGAGMGAADHDPRTGGPRAVRNGAGVPRQ